MQEIVLSVVLIIVTLVLVSFVFTFMMGRFEACSPQISIWSLLQNGTLKKDYTQLNDELNISFNAPTFPMNYEIKLSKVSEQILLAKGQINDTSYSVLLKLNDTGLLDISVISKNCGANSRIIEIITPSQQEIASMSEQIKQIRRELEIERQEREKDTWKSNISFIASIISIVISSVAGILTIREKIFKKPKLKNRI